MERFHKDIIRSNYRALREQIHTGVEDICMDLYQDNFFSLEMREDILCKNTSSRQASAFLDQIVRRGPHAFNALYESCKRNHLYDAADILMPCNKPHEPEQFVMSNSVVHVVESEEQKMLNENWPTEAYFSLILGLRLPVSEVEDRQLYGEHKTNQEYFRMTEKTRGHPLLIYDGTLPFTADRRGLSTLFENLHFSTLKLLNVFNEEKLKFLQKSMPEPCDCFVLFIISNGGNRFLSSDHIVSDILNILKDRPDLAGKPKLIFHINQQTADYTKAESGAVAELENPFRKIKLESRNQSLPQHEERNSDINKSKPNGKDDLDSGIKLSKVCDFILIRSTDHGNEVLESPESKEKWTRLIQLIVNVFSKCAMCCDFYHLIRLVNLKAGTNVAILSRDSASKKLQFFPGCYDV